MNENEQDYIYNIKKNIDVDESLAALYKMHSKIYYKIIHKYFSSSNYSDKKSELIEECSYNIYFAAIEYDETKNTKFSSYLANKARWMCLNFFNAERKKQRLEDDPDLNQDDSTSIIPFLLKKERFSRIQEEIYKDQDDRVAEIFKLRYFDSKTNKLTSWKDVSSKLSLSVQGCINIHNKFLKKLQSRIEK